MFTNILAKNLQDLSKFTEICHKVIRIVFQLLKLTNITQITSNNCELNDQMGLQKNPANPLRGPIGRKTAVTVTKATMRLDASTVSLSLLSVRTLLIRVRVFPERVI